MSSTSDNDRTPPQFIAFSYGKVKGRARSYPYYQGAVYGVRLRKSDNTLVAYYHSHVGVARRSSTLAERDIREYAEKNGLVYVGHMRHGDVIDMEVDRMVESQLGIGVQR